MEKIEAGAPFRATRLWNMVATAFERQMPVRKHWSRLQKYEDSFTGAEAVEWMHAYLKNNPNFGEKCTRTIAVKMLQKLLMHDSFQRVRPSGKDQHSQKFKEDGQLYKFPSSSFSGFRLVKPQPLSHSNGQSKSLSLDYGANPPQDSTPKITAEDVWMEEFYYYLAKLLQLDSDVEICPFSDKAVEVDSVIKNVTLRPEPSDVIPDFVVSAMRSLENWPDTGKGVPNCPGFERSLLHVVEAFLRGTALPIVDGATADLLKRCSELLLPSIPRRHSISIDTSSSVESFMMEILNTSDAISQAAASGESVCFETAFTGTVPETRLVRKRPRSNSLFPTTDCAVQFGPTKCPSSRSGSSDCILPKSSSSFSSTGSSPLPRTPNGCSNGFRTSGSSLERLNPGYRDDSFDDLDDQFYTPIGKSSMEGLLDDMEVACPKLARSLQLVLHALAPKSRMLLQVVLKMFEKVFKNNQLSFSPDLPTASFIIRCFTPIVFPSADPTFMRLLRFMILNSSTIFEHVGDFKLKVELKMKALGIVPAFCKRITKQEYEEQKRLQNSHMTILLESILMDGTMSVKDKRKKLKQFQKQYPEVYAARLASSTSEESIFAACAEEKPKPRLTKFKSLRL